MELFWQDVRFGLRQLWQNPGFTISAIAALALGIGANTAIFSVVNTVLLKPLTYPDADRMVNFLFSASGIANNLHNIAEFHFFQRQTNLFKEVVAFDNAGPGFNLTGGSRPEQVNGIHVTEGYFRVYGAPVALGRTFTPQEDSPHGGRVVVLSYGLWQRRFGGDPAIVGKSISLGNEPYTVVGVVGKDFVGDLQADLWLPFQIDPVSSDGNVFFYVTGLLQPGVTVAQANAQLQAVAHEFRREFPSLAWVSHFRVGPLRDSIIGDARNSLLMIMGAVGLVLLIACANVANLLLVRATVRKREFAIRSALGAGRARIVRQLLTESVLLSLAGGILGMALGFAGMRALLAVSPAGLPRIGEDGSAISIDWRVLGFTLGVSLLDRHSFWTITRFQRFAFRLELHAQGERQPLGHRIPTEKSPLAAGRQRNLAGPGAADRRGASDSHLHRPARGRSRLRFAQCSDDGDVAQRPTLPEHGRPGAALAGWTQPAQCSPWSGSCGCRLLAAHRCRRWHGVPAGRAPGRSMEKDCCSSEWMSITPGYLSLFKIPLLRGRDFTENDNADAPAVDLINEAFARKFFPHEDPVGQHIMHGAMNSSSSRIRIETIIGLVADFHDSGLAKPADPMIIAPIAQVSDGYNAAYANIQPLFWLVRTHGDPHASIPAITEQLRIASDGFAVAHIRTMDEVMGHSTARQSFNMLLLTIFGAVALLLAAIGIYGFMAYSVAQRTQEMGIRMALGADRNAIRRLVVWQGMRLAFVGVVDRHRCVLRPYSPLVHLPLRRQALGSRGLRIGATHSHCGCSAGRVAACRARLQSRSHAGVAHGVIRKRLSMTA